LGRLADRGSRNDGPGQRGVRGADEIQTAARVHLDKANGGFAITTVELRTTVRVSGLSLDEFQRHADEAKGNCPVSEALAWVKIELEAELAG
jgi:lipoyl-dependent peroxiredoxin